MLYVKAALYCVEDDRVSSDSMTNKGGTYF